MKGGELVGGLAGFSVCWLGPRSLGGEQALFRFAPESSRASPYKKGQAEPCLCASTTQGSAWPFLHCSLLSCTLYHTKKKMEMGGFSTGGIVDNVDSVDKRFGEYLRIVAKLVEFLINPGFPRLSEFLLCG